MSNILIGNVAVVTGAGRGIGRSVAIDLARNGAKVIVNGRSSSAEAANEVVETIKAEGGEATVVLEDVSTMKGGKALIDAAIDIYGKLDTLVCNAGIISPATIFNLTEDDWDTVMTINLKGYFTVSQPAAIRMRDQKSGSIIMMTSLGGLQGSPRQPNYAASKEGIIGLMRSIALEIAPDVTCNAIAPSALTRMQQQMSPGRDPGKSEEVAPVVSFLASPAARHITGQVIGAAGNRVSIFPQPRVYRSAFADGQWTADRLAEIWDSSLGFDQLVAWERFVTNRGK